MSLMTDGPTNRDAVSAKAGQMVSITYPNDLTNRLVFGRGGSTFREVVMTTDQAVDLYNQLRSALFD